MSYAQQNVSEISMDFPRSFFAICHKGLFIFFAICVALKLGISPAFCDSRDPVETLRQIGMAVDTADGEAFQQLVDLDSLLGDALGTVLSEAQKPENLSKIQPMIGIIITQAASGNAQGEALRNMIRGEAKAFVLNGVNSGAFAGNIVNNSQSSGLLAPLFAYASQGRKEIRGIGDPRRQGDNYLVPFSVHDYGNEQDYDVVGRFSPSENGLRLTAIENLQQLFSQIQQEARALGE